MGLIRIFGFGNRKANFLILHARASQEMTHRHQQSADQQRTEAHDQSHLVVSQMIQEIHGGLSFPNILIPDEFLF
jgi:hypothetical protein